MPSGGRMLHSCGAHPRFMARDVTDEQMKYQRIDENRIAAADSPFLVTIFANDKVKIDRAALTELSALAHLPETLETLHAARPGAFTEHPRIERVAVTPDFHKGTGIPVGTVLKTRRCCFPKAVGNDIGCGMVLFALNGIAKEDVAGRRKELVKSLRRIFWEGGRNIPLTGEQRRCLLENGVKGLLEAPGGRGGIWNELDTHRRNLSSAAVTGSRSACSPVFDGYCGPDGVTYDSQIGSVGGGNHFVEIQHVRKSMTLAWQDRRESTKTPCW